MHNSFSKSPTMASEFPQDIVLFNILPRLPGNSVIRFKCVSKQWNSFLSTPLFKKMHLHNIPNDDHHNPHKLLILLSAKSSWFRTMDCEAPEDGLTTGRNLPFKVTNHELSIVPLTSFHGLVCVGLRMYVNLYLYLYYIIMHG